MSELTEMTPGHKVEFWFRTHTRILLAVTAVLVLTVIGGSWWAVSSIKKANARADAAETKATDAETRLAVIEKEIVLIKAESELVRKENETLKAEALKRAEADAMLSKEQALGLVKSESVVRPIERKIVSDPVAFGFKGNTQNKKAVQKFARKEANSLVRRAGMHYLAIRPEFVGKVSEILGSTKTGQPAIVFYVNDANGKLFSEPDAVLPIMPEGQKAKRVLPKYYMEEINPWCWDKGDPENLLEPDVLYNSVDCRKQRSSYSKQ